MLSVLPSMRKVYFFIIPVCASFLTGVASFLFATPQGHGFFSVDVLFLLLFFLLPRGKFLWKMPFVIIVWIYAIASNSIDAYATAGIVFILVVLSAAIPRNRQFLLPAFIVLALFSSIADWANFFYATFVLTLSDVWGLAKFFWWGPCLFLLIPLLQILLEVFFARKILWGERLEISHLTAYVIATLVIGLNFSISALQLKQPILDFSVKKWMWQLCTPGIIGHNLYLQEDIKAAFSIWEKKKSVITDFSKPTVVVLIESFGVNKSMAYTDSLLALYKNSKVAFIGLFPRDAAHTQGAEWEDFGAPQGSLNEKIVPQQFKANGLETWFLHGYDGDFYERDENYDKFGFDHLLFKKDFEERNFSSCQYGFKGICDSSVAVFIDSLLADSLPKFIYWTTLDAHPPYEFAKIREKSIACESLALSDVDCTYFTLQQNTARYLVQLAQKYPNYRFVIRGDHRPMGSLEQSDFVQSFYFRWVPLVILN